MSKGRGVEGERGTATERKCCAYLTDTDTHINGTDCAAPIAESYLNYIYMALVPSCASSSSSSSSLSASLACQRCRRPHPKPRRIRQPVLSALRQWKRWEKRMNGKRMNENRNPTATATTNPTPNANERQRFSVQSIQIHSWKSEQIFVLHFIIMSGGWVCLPHRCSYNYS